MKKKFFLIISLFRYIEIKIIIITIIIYNNNNNNNK